MEWMRDDVRDFVRTRYGRIAKSGGSCCPSCGCGDSDGNARSMSYSEDDLRSAPPESMMGLGCGNPIAYADLTPGEVVLDLGSGGGIDVFLAAKRVGEKGRVIGVDMTDEMLGRARDAAVQHGFMNVEFRKGEIESLPVGDSSVDVVISNCVINLSVDKARVFREIHRVLKPGGRMVVSDLVTNGDLPEDLKRSLDAWASCIAGAVEKEVYISLIRESGLEDIRIMAESGYSGGVPEFLTKIKSITIYAAKPKV